MAVDNLPYTRTGYPGDLYAFRTREDACAAWALRATADLAPVDAIRVLTGVRRRIACLHINGLLVADVRHPRVLRLAGVDREELALPGLHAGRRLAAAARRIPGVGGLSVPPLTPGASDALVIFPESVAGHVELVHAPVQTVTPAFPSTRRPGSPPEAEPVVIDFARLRPGVRRPNVRSRALSNGT